MTSNNDALRRRVTDQHGILTPAIAFDLFDDIVVSGEVKLVKPDPRIYWVVLERTARTADECLFIDDSEANVAAARQLGFRTIRFESLG